MNEAWRSAPLVEEKQPAKEKWRDAPLLSESDIPPERLAATEEANRIAEAHIVQSGTGGKVGGFTAKAVQGLPFVGEFIDEGLEKIQPGAGERLTAMQEAYEVTNPKTALAAEIGGGVVGSLPLAIGAVGAAGKAASTGGKVLRGMALGGTGGAVEGAAQGAGAAESGARLAGAAEGAMMGGTLGAALGGVMPGADAGGKAILRRIKRLDIDTISQNLGVSKKAARVVKSALRNDDMEGAMRAIERAGDDAMLADAGPAARQLLDAAQQTGGEALSVSRDRVNRRAAKQGQQFRRTLDDILGKPEGIRAAAEEISEKTAPARKAAYDQAFSSQINYASDAGRKIEEVLERIPPKTLQDAINEANEAMLAEGLKNQQLLAEIAEDGAVSFKEMPNAQQLDQIKRALGDFAAGEVDQFGRKTARGARAQRLAGQLRDAISDAVPGYRRAVRIGGDKIAMDNALDMGRSLLTKRTTVEDVSRIMDGASREVELAAKRGLREGIDTVMENARTTLSEIEAGAFDFDAGQNAAKEALDALRALTVPANLKKVKLVLGDGAKPLISELQRTSDALTLRAALARNSATAVRQAVQGQVKDETQPRLLQRFLGEGGNPLEAARELTRSIAGTDPGSMSEAQRQIFAEIADTLTQKRGARANRALKAINQAMQGQPLKERQVEEISRVLTGSLASAGYQPAVQLHN